RSVTTGPWWAPTCRSPSPDGLRRRSAGQPASARGRRYAWREAARAVDSSVAADRLLAGPPVVGLACRAAFDDRPEYHRLGQLVPGDQACGVVDEFLGVDARSVDECDDRDDLLPPALARPARDDHIGHGRVRCDRRLDLLDEDLFATGVDAYRVPPEQLDGAVGEMACPISGHRVPHTTDDRERRRRFGRISLVAQRHVAPLREPADPAGPRI